MQASVGGGGSGAAARAAGPDSLPLRERPENACMQRVLREIDGLGFCRSSLAGRRLNPTPELAFQYKERGLSVVQQASSGQLLVSLLSEADAKR